MLKHSVVIISLLSGAVAFAIAAQTAGVHIRDWIVSGR